MSNIVGSCVCVYIYNTNNNETTMDIYIYRVGSHGICHGNIMRYIQCD